MQCREKVKTGRFFESSRFFGLWESQFVGAGEASSLKKISTLGRMELICDSQKKVSRLFQNQLLFKIIDEIHFTVRSEERFSRNAETVQ